MKVKNCLVTEQQYLQDIYEQLHGRIVTKNICYACRQKETNTVKS